MVRFLSVQRLRHLLYGKENATSLPILPYSPQTVGERTPLPSPLAKARERGGEMHTVEMLTLHLTLVPIPSPLPPLHQPGAGAGGGVGLLTKTTPSPKHLDLICISPPLPSPVLQLRGRGGGWGHFPQLA